jgi:cytochrome c oxidase subunit II
MNDTQVVIAVGYTALVIAVGVVAALVLRSTRSRPDGEVDTGRLASLEGRWGAIVVAALGVLLFATIFSVPYGNTRGGEDAQHVTVTGQQFGWAVQPAEVEAGREVQFKLVSKDVQHGFGVYDGTELVFQVQVPAKGQTPQLYTHTFERSGTYDILCLEFCGAQHHAMRGTLRVR